MIKNNLALFFNIFNYIQKNDLIIIALLIIFAIFVLIVFLVYIHFQKRRIKKDLDKHNFTRMFIFDLLEKKVMYYDISSPSNRKELTLEDFYKSFENQEAENFAKWLKNVLDKPSVEPNHFICFNNNRALKNNVLFLYRIIKTNQKEQVIYIESLLFKNIIKENVTKGYRNTFFDEYSIINYHESIKKKKKSVAIYVINTFNSNIKVFENNLSTKYLLLLTLLDKLMPRFKSSHFFYFINNNCLCIIDFKPFSNSEISSFASLLSNELKKIVSYGPNINSSFDYRVSVNYEWNYKIIDLKGKIRSTIDYSIYAKNSKTEEKVIYFNKNVNLNKSFHSVVVDEINRIIRFNAIKVLYTPYVDIKSGKTRGYIEQIQIASDVINELHDFEIEIYNQGKETEFLDLLIGNSLKAFNDVGIRKKKRTLLVPLYLPYLMVLNKTLEKFDLEDQLIILLDVNQLNYWDNKDNTYSSIDIIKKASKLNVKFALKIDKANIHISNELQNYFSYIVFSDELIHGIKNNAYTRIRIEEYIANNKKLEFIALGINTWSGTELLLSLGINYLSGSIIADTLETLEDVSKKTSKTLLDYNE